MALIASILSKFDDSGVKKAQTAFSGLKKVLSVGLAVEGLKHVGEELLKFAEVADKDQKSMQLLNNQLARNAHATKTQTKQNEVFIKTLSQQVGITKDRLRPAQAKLARATGDVTQSQKLLKLALDASAVSGKPLETVSLALAKAYTGNTGALARMFPELKKSKNAIADLNKEVSGSAAQQANPFDKLNVAMTNLQIKIGEVILPYFEKFVDAVTKPGGMGDQIGKFFEDLSNPKTDVGRIFKDIKSAVDNTITGLKEFFGFFGGGDAMKGFVNIASSLTKMLPALLAIKGIMLLAQAGSAIKNLALAIGMIQGKNVGDNIPTVVGGGGRGAAGKAGSLSNLGKVKSVLGVAGWLGLGASALMAGSDLMNSMNRDAANKQGVNWDAGMAAGVNLAQMMRTPAGLAMAQKMFPTNGSTNVTINVHSADPKAVVDALGKYVKTNGNLPKILTNRNGR